MKKSKTRKSKKVQISESQVLEIEKQLRELIAKLQADIEITKKQIEDARKTNDYLSELLRRKLDTPPAPSPWKYPPVEPCSPISPERHRYPQPPYSPPIIWCCARNNG